MRVGTRAGLVNVIERQSGKTEGQAVFTGTLTLDVLLGDVRSLKQKRSVVRPIVAELRRKLEVSVAEVGHLDLYRRTEIGLAVVSADPAHVHRVLDTAERMVADRPEIELLSARRALHRADDWEPGTYHDDKGVARDG
jgi:uncharacterized protein YlxP (DUF503 family)